MPLVTLGVAFALLRKIPRKESRVKTGLCAVAGSVYPGLVPRIPTSEGACTSCAHESAGKSTYSEYRVTARVRYQRNVRSNKGADVLVAQRVLLFYYIDKLVVRRILGIELRSVWGEDVEERGLEEVRKIAGYHDEPRKGPVNGQRSIRFANVDRAKACTMVLPMRTGDGTWRQRTTTSWRAVDSDGYTLTVLQRGAMWEWSVRDPGGGYDLYKGTSDSLEAAKVAAQDRFRALSEEIAVRMNARK
jgi:hypothetical protein